MVHDTRIRKRILAKSSSARAARQQELLLALQKHAPKSHLLRSLRNCTLDHQAPGCSEACFLHGRGYRRAALKELLHNVSFTATHSVTFRSLHGRVPVGELDALPLADIASGLQDLFGRMAQKTGPFRAEGLIDVHLYREDEGAPEWVAEAHLLLEMPFNYRRRDLHPLFINNGYDADVAKPKRFWQRAAVSPAPAGQLMEVYTESAGHTMKPSRPLPGRFQLEYAQWLADWAHMCRVRFDGIPKRVAMTADEVTSSL